MRTYKPEGATHYADGLNGGTIWYKRWSDGSWSVWWQMCCKWRPMYGQPVVAVRPVVSDTGANQ